MKNPTDQPQTIQILYEIAVAIGTSLNLPQMLKTSLSAMLEKLNCDAGGVMALTRISNDHFAFEPVCSIHPSQLESAAYQSARGQLPPTLTQPNWLDYGQQLPCTGQSGPQDFYYILHLPDYGVLILTKKGDGLAPDLLERLKPLLVKLAGACNACNTQAALQQSREQFRQVVASISPHIYVTEFTAGGERINRYISPNVEPLTGYPLKEFTSNWAFWPTTVIHPDDRAIAGAQARKLELGINSTTEYRLIRADGSIAWVQDSARVETNGENRVVYGAITDITRQKEDERALTEAHRQALEASHLKSELLANVSHDLRAPLNAIMGYSEMLERGLYGDLTLPQHEAIAEIIASTGQLLSFINNLLGQAQIESGQIILNNIQFSPADLFASIQATLNVMARIKKLALSYTIDPQVPPLLTGDPYWLRQVLLNLVGNAIKYTHEGAVQVQIFCPDDQHWAMQVTDTGPGISPEAQDYIFDAFRRDQNDPDAAQMSSGLGLAIVKKLTILMGGGIDLNSHLGQGTTFTITFPLEPEWNPPESAIWPHTDQEPEDE